MKTNFLTAVLAIFSLVSSAQITLDHKYDYSTSVVKLETKGYKYYLMDVPTAQCRIYNMDHSLYKTITCNVPNGYYLTDIKYVSENLFDADVDIEILYTYYKYVATSTSYYYIYGSRIVNDNGSVMLTIDGAQYNFVNKTGDSTWKLFSYCYDYSVFPEKVWTNIYNLPGQLYSAIALVDDKSGLTLKSYPNPVSETLKIEYSLPENAGTGMLYLLDSNGRSVQNFQVDNHINHLDIDVTGMKPGTYFYFVESGGKRSETGKAVVL